MTLPPRAVRRVVGPLVLVVTLALTLALLPLLVVLAAVSSVWMQGRWRGLRLLAFAIVGLSVELYALVAAAWLWMASGCGRRLNDPRYLRAHYRVLRIGLRTVVRVALRLFKLQLQTDHVSWSPLDDGVPGSDNAMVVLARHAGPGDSVLLLDTLMNRDHLREPRTVMKDTLQLDPLADTFFHRLPSRFIESAPAAGRGDHVEQTIASLAADLGTEDALLIFPEGGNFTTRRRSRAISKLRERGHSSYADQAEAMSHVLPPKPGGVSAALTAAPQADVVFVAHTGLEHITGLRSVWRTLPQDKTLQLRWWFHPAEEVPRDEQTQLRWLFERWAEIDAWIEAQQPT